MANTLNNCSFLSSFDIQLIVSSPLRRALDTTFGVLQHQLNIIETKNIPIIAHHELREWVDTLGDIGTAKSKLIQTYNVKQARNVDFSIIQDEFWWNQNIETNKGKIIKESKENVQHRISAFKHWILQREENNILVIGHSRYFREFVGAMFKLNNCGMMKVELHGMKVHSWQYIDFSKIEAHQKKIKSIVELSMSKQSSS